MSASPSKTSDFEAAAAQVLAKLNRSGAIDRLRKAVESRMTGDSRRMNKLQADIAHYLKDHAPKTPAENFDPKAIVTLAKKHVLTPALEQDIRQDIQSALGQLHIAPLFDAELNKLSHIPPEKKKPDIDQVKAKTRKAFLANIIKPMNPSKQQRMPERHPVRHPTQPSTSLNRAAPPPKPSRPAATSNPQQPRKIRRQGEHVARGTSLPPNGKRPRAPASSHNHAGRIPPSAAKPPAGPHKAELRRVAESTTHDKGLATRDEAQRSRAARPSLEKRGNPASTADIKRPTSAENTGTKPLDGSATRIPAPRAPPKRNGDTDRIGRPRDEDEHRDNPSATTDQRPPSADSDRSVGAGAASHDCNPPNGAGMPLRSGTRPKTADIRGDITTSGEGHADANDSTENKKETVSDKARMAGPAPFEKEKYDIVEASAGTVEDDAMDLESPLPSWRRPASRSNWRISGNEHSWTSDSSSEGSEIRRVMETEEPKAHGGTNGTDVSSPAVSSSSHEEQGESEDANFGSSEEVSPGPLSRSKRRPDEPEDVSYRSPGNVGSAKDDSHTKSPRKEGRENRSVRGMAKGRVQKPLASERSSMGPENNSRSVGNVSDPSRSTFSCVEAEDGQAFPSKPQGERNDRDGAARKEKEIDARAGTMDNATGQERKRPRVKYAPSRRKRSIRSKADEPHHTRKRLRVSPADTCADSSYDFEEQQKVLRALLKLAKEPHAYPFLLPVDPKDEGCENYYNEIPNPMNIYAITERLESSTPAYGHYASVEDVIQDVELIWSNCRDFNGSYDPVVKDADKCVNSLDILLEKEGCQRGVSGRSKRRRSRGKPSSGHDNEAEVSDSRCLESKATVRMPNSKKEKVVRQVELARENRENDGHLVGQDVIVFTKDGSKKSWLPIDVLGHDRDSCTYTVRWRRSGETMEMVRFGPFTPYPIVRIAGQPT